jgi:hypothetical protein
MLRNLTRGAMLCAVLCALGAITACSALAAAGEFTIGASPAVITGEQKTQNIFAVTNTAGSLVQVKASVATFEGTSSTASGTDLTVTATYSGVTLGGLAATVRMNGCKFTFTGTATLTALVDIVGCTASKTITITKGNCVISIPEQSGLSHVTFTSEGSASEMDALASVTITGIHNTQTGSECPAPGLTSAHGSYSGTITVRAFSDTGSRSVTKHEHTYVEAICGTQVSFTVD